MICKKFITHALVLVWGSFASIPPKKILLLENDSEIKKSEESPAVELVCLFFTLLLIFYYMTMCTKKFIIKFHLLFLHLAMWYLHTSTAPAITIMVWRDLIKNSSENFFTFWPNFTKISSSNCTRILNINEPSFHKY